MAASAIDIKPRSWMLALCFVAMAAGVALMFVLPNPFGGLGLYERPSKTLFLFWVLAIVLTLAAVYRVIVWSSFHIVDDVLERRFWSGVHRFERADLTSARIERAKGRPRVLVMRFKPKREVRVASWFFSSANFAALSAFAGKEGR
ncbi:hypothetical protein [Candidatus Viadribacter manganicus]|uniref:Uncharacterized protein n=1 Tax=Candidatus Viadribacter manganicus TaxID=1759059 RepID=A0A1B1AMH9_9PROT|nr:hypothetical protein [Candidatus Viadribacter manganicus]ANP47782.1 hypothetical protein ATE48_18705 [Candidatus Viadribacter manganicus]